MYCFNCGKEVPNGSVACPACGTSIGESHKAPEASTSSSQQGVIPKSSTRRGKIIVFSFLALLVLAVVALIVWRSLPNDKSRIEDELYRIMEEELHGNTDLFTVERVTYIYKAKAKEGKYAGEGAFYLFTIRTCGGDQQIGGAVVFKAKDKEREVKITKRPELFRQIESLNLK